MSRTQRKGDHEFQVSNAGWIIRNKDSGEPIVEVHSNPEAWPALLDHLEWVSCAQHLEELNDPRSAAYRWATR